MKRLLLAGATMAALCAPAFARAGRDGVAISPDQLFGFAVVALLVIAALLWPRSVLAACAVVMFGGVFVVCLGVVLADLGLIK